MSLAGVLVGCRAAPAANGSADASSTAVLVECRPPPAVTGSLDASSTGDGDVDTATADDAAATVSDYRPYPHGGLTMFVAASLDKLGVPAEKRAEIQKIQRDLDASAAPVRAAERSLVSTLADGVSAGEVDVPAVDAALARFKSVAEASRGPSAEAMDELHSTLTPAERVALTDEMEARWLRWRNANAANPLGVGFGANGPGAMSRLERFGGGQFGLSASQVERIRARLHATAGTPPDEPATGLATELDARVHAFRAAFVRDSFDARVVTSRGGADTATTGALRMVRFLEGATPVLTCDQRDQLSAHLRDRYGNFEIVRQITLPDPFGYFGAP